jgi:hypothetical protein
VLLWFPGAARTADSAIVRAEKLFLYTGCAAVDEEGQTRHRQQYFDHGPFSIA